MLCVNTYPRDYIDGCRQRLDAQLAAYRLLVKAAAPGSAAGGRQAGAIDAFAPLFFDHLLLALDASFMHRSRTLERKDGNAMNEVRLLCHSILNNAGRLATDKTIKVNLATSVLKRRPGEAVALTEAEFTRLSAAFFDEIAATYGQ